MRPDGRLASELRPVRLTPGCVGHQEGSVDARVTRATRDLRGRTHEIKRLIARRLCAGVDPTAVMIDRGRFIEVQGTTEGEPFEQAALDAMLNLAKAGIHQLLPLQAAVSDEWGID